LKSSTTDKFKTCKQTQQLQVTTKHAFYNNELE